MNDGMHSRLAAVGKSMAKYDDNEWGEFPFCL